MKPRYRFSRKAYLWLLVDPDGSLPWALLPQRVVLR